MMFKAGFSRVFGGFYWALGFVFILNIVGFNNIRLKEVKALASLRGSQKDFSPPLVFPSKMC